MTAQRKKVVLTSPPSVADLRAQLVKRGMVAPTLSVVVPVKDEEDAILPFVTRVGAILDSISEGGGWEILFVDDGEYGTADGNSRFAFVSRFFPSILINSDLFRLLNMKRLTAFVIFQSRALQIHSVLCCPNSR